MKLSRRTVKSLNLERGIDLFDQQASESTASSCISCYRLPTSIQIHFSQMNLWSRGIERSDEWLLTAISNRLLLRKKISSYLATSCLIAQYKIYGARSRAGALMFQIRCKWYSWAETADIREIALPCLSTPEDMHTDTKWDIMWD